MLTEKKFYSLKKASKALSMNDIPKSPSEYEKFICENVIKNSQKFQQNDSAFMSENDQMLRKSFDKNKGKEAKDSEDSDESEAEIDLVTTNRTQVDPFVLDFSNRNTNNNNNNNVSSQKNNHFTESGDKSV